jgi:hypothetical protein
MMVESEAALRV